MSWIRTSGSKGAGLCGGGLARLLGLRDCSQVHGYIEYLGNFLTDPKTTGIVDGLSVTPGGNQLVFAQPTQMLRKSAFAKSDQHSQFANRNLAFRQMAQNHKSSLIAQNRQKFGRWRCMVRQPVQVRRVCLQGVDRLQSPDRKFFAIVLH